MDHVGPEPGVEPERPGPVQQAAEVLDEDLLPAVQLEDLVTADVDGASGVVAGQLGDEVQREAGVVFGGGQRTGLGGRRVDGPVPVLGQAQPSFEVAEGVLVGHQRDAPGCGLGVEPGHVVGGHGRGVPPDRLVVGVGEGVLGVELEVVDAQPVEAVQQGEQTSPVRHPVPTDVEHEPPLGQVRPVPDAARHQALSPQLRQRRQPVAPAGLVGAGEGDAVVRQGQVVPLSRQVGVGDLGDGHVVGQPAVGEVDLSGSGDDQRRHRHGLPRGPYARRRAHAVVVVRPGQPGRGAGQAAAVGAGRGRARPRGRRAGRGQGRGPGDRGPGGGGTAGRAPRPGGVRTGQRRAQRLVRRRHGPGPHPGHRRRRGAQAGVGRAGDRGGQRPRRARPRPPRDRRRPGDRRGGGPGRGGLGRLPGPRRLLRGRGLRGRPGRGAHT